MKYTSTFLWLSAALLSAAPADKTLNLSIYDTTATSFLNRAFTVSGNNGKVLGISGGDWALVTASGSSSLTSTQIAYGDGSNVQTSEAAFAYNSTLNILSVDAIKLFATGVGISAASSGVLKLEGLGSGFDEAINMDFDTTSNVVQTSSPATGVTIMDYLDMSLRVTDGGGNFATLGPSGITVHNSAWAGNYTLAFGGTDGDAETIASQEWVTANAAAFDATAVDSVTWSDGANASNVWTFNVSGTDPTLTAGNSNFIFGATSIDLGSAGVRLSQDGDGALTFLGLGNGSDEDLTLNFDDTSNSIVASSSTGAGLDLSGLAAVNIGTLQGTEGSHLHVIYSSVGSGTAYTMTAAYAAVDMGTTDPSVTIAATGTYRIYANIQVNFAGATYAAFDQAAFKLRRTNNTAADLTDGERGCSLPIMTTTTMLGPSVTIGPIEYTTTNTDDVIVIHGDLNATPSAGTITVTKATIFAERVRQ